MNLYAFTGNLGRDAEVKFTQGGTAVCSFSVAVKSGFGDRAKDNWIQCRIYGKRAEGNLPQHLTTGTKVAVHGEASLETWQKGDGSMGAAICVNVLDVTLLSASGKDSGAPNANQAPQRQQAQQPAQQSQAGGFDDFDDQGIPF